MKPTWTKYYYDILDFYYWEPQHLGKIKNPNRKYRTYDDIFDHLGKMEVSLNHQLALFFNIIPEGISNGLLKAMTDGKAKDKYIYESHKTAKIIEKLNDFTQPDFLFEGKHSLLAIEVKLDSWSSLDQLMKYLFLYVLLKKKLKYIKRFSLIYLAKDKFDGIWEQKYNNKDELLEAFKKYEIPDYTAKGDINIKPYKKAILKAIEETDIHFVNFQQFLRLLDSEKKKLGRSESGRGWANFIDGLQGELKNRKLIK